MQDHTHIHIILIGGIYEIALLLMQDHTRIAIIVYYIFFKVGMFIGTIDNESELHNLVDNY